MTGETLSYADQQIEKAKEEMKKVLQGTSEGMTLKSLYQNLEAQGFPEEFIKSAFLGLVNIHVIDMDGNRNVFLVQEEVESTPL